MIPKLLILDFHGFENYPVPHTYNNCKWLFHHGSDIHTERK